jgi:hypothetical protein
MTGIQFGEVPNHSVKAFKREMDTLPSPRGAAAQIMARLTSDRCLCDVLFFAEETPRWLARRRYKSLCN